MKIRSRVMYALVIALGALACVYTWVEIKEGESKIKATLSKTVDTVEKFINFEVWADVQLMQASMDSISQNPVLIKLLKNKNKERLIEETQSMFQRLKEKNKITHLYFHRADRTTLVEFHEEEHFDDLIERETLKEAAWTGAPSFGIEQAPSGASILLVVYPVYSGKTKIGYLELGKELQDVVNTIDNIVGLKVFVFAEKKSINRAMWEDRNKKLTYATSWDFLPSMVVMASTIPVVPQELKDFKFDEERDSGYVVDDLQIKIDAATYRVMALPFHDMTSRKFAQIVLLYDTSARIEAQKKSTIITASSSLVVMFLLLGFFYIFLGRVESMIGRQQASMVSSSKMASLGEMASGLAHEINTPLGALIMHAQMIVDYNQEQSVPDTEIETRTLTILKISDRIAKTVAGLKGFARDAKDSDVQIFSVKEWVDETLSLCHEKFKKHNVSIIVKEENMDLQLQAQLVGLSQILLNLLGNSFDAIHKSENPWVEIEAVINNQKLEVYVTDCGAGISKEVVDKIFEPFFTTKEIGVGTGLGLSISKGIISAQNGNLFYDHKCKNTRFVIQLPIFKKQKEVA